MYYCYYLFCICLVRFIYLYLFVHSPQLQEVVRGLGDATSRVWVYLMCSGGYFAGSVFDGNKVIAHKVGLLSYSLVSGAALIS